MCFLLDSEFSLFFEIPILPDHHRGRREIREFDAGCLNLKEKIQMLTRKRHTL